MTLYNNVKYRKISLSLLIFLFFSPLLAQQSLVNAIDELEHDYYSYILPGENYWDSTYIQKESGFGLNLGVGYNNRLFLDLGMAYGAYQSFGVANLQSTIYIGSEFLFREDDVIYGPKIASWTVGILGIISSGYNLIYYTNFNEGSWQFRPELGIGYKQLKLNYGYNIPINNRTFADISRHNLSLVWFLKLSTHKSESYTYREIFDGEIELLKEQYQK